MSTGSNVTNLNQFRKAKARAEKRARADENAVKFGRTKAQKSIEEAQKSKAESELDGHELGGRERDTQDRDDAE